MNYSGPVRTGRVGVGELTALLTIYTATDVFLSYPSRVAKESAESGWMIPLVSGVIVLAVFLIINACMKRFPDENILDVARQELTVFVSVPLGIIFMLLFFSQTALVMREFTETVITTVLPRTPSTVVALLFMAVVYYFAYKGIEGLSRLAMLLSAILGIGLLSLLIMPLTWFDVHLLQPFWGRGMLTTIFYGGTNTSMFLNVLLLSLLYPTVRNQRQFVRVGVISIGLTAVLMSLVLIVFIGVFPAAPTGQVPFPMYQLARLIYIGRFVQRLESVFVFLWTAAAVLKMGLGLWMTAYLYASTFKMPLYRPLLPAIALALYVVSFLPPDFPSVQLISANIFEPYGWTVSIALPVVIAVVLYLRSGRAQGNHSKRRIARAARAN